MQNDKFKNNDNVDEDFLSALLADNVDGVRAAIGRGANVNQPLPDGLHPLAHLLLKYTEFAYKADGTVRASLKKEVQSQIEIAGLIIEESLDVTTVDAAGCSYTDRLLAMLPPSGRFDTNEVAKAVTATIHDAALAGMEYDVNYRSIFGGLGIMGEPLHPQRQAAMKNIERVLHRVAERFQPQDGGESPTAKERRLMDDKHFAPVVAKWSAPPVLPALTELPMPTRSLVAAAIAAELACELESDAFSAMIRSSWQGDNEGFHKAENLFALFGVVAEIAEEDHDVERVISDLENQAPKKRKEGSPHPPMR